MNKPNDSDNRIELETNNLSSRCAAGKIRSYARNMMNEVRCNLHSSGPKTSTTRWPRCRLLDNSTFIRVCAWFFRFRLWPPVSNAVARIYIQRAQKKKYPNRHGHNEIVTHPNFWWPLALPLPLHFNSHCLLRKITMHCAPYNARFHFR